MSPEVPCPVCEAAGAYRADGKTARPSDPDAMLCVYCSGIGFVRLPEWLVDRKRAG